MPDTWDKIAGESRFWAAMANKHRRLEKFMRAALPYNPWPDAVFVTLPDPPPCDAAWTD